MRIGCNSVVVEKDSSCELYDVNVSCISPLYVCFFNFKIKTRDCIFNAGLRYLTINYFESGMWNTEREDTLYIPLSLQIAIN